MAFIGMFFVMIAVFAGVMLGLLLLGIIFMIIAHVKRKKAEAQHKKYHMVLACIGAVILLVPITITQYLVGSVAVSVIETAIHRANYNNCVDKWKYEWVSDDTVKNDVMSSMTQAIDNSDKEAIKALFTKKIQNDPRLLEQIDEFLKQYPKGAVWKHNNGSLSSGSSSDHGKRTEHLTCRSVLESEGELYYVYFSVCYQNEYDEDKVGIERFYVNSSKAEVMADNEDADRYDENDYIKAVISVDTDFETRLVRGYSYMYYPYERSITLEQAVDALKKSETPEDLEHILGKPNGERKKHQEVMYEIETDGKEPRYIIFRYDDDGKIRHSSAIITGPGTSNIKNLDIERNVID